MARTRKANRRAAKLLKYYSRLLARNGVTPPHFVAIMDNLSIGDIAHRLIQPSLLLAVASLKIPDDPDDWRPGGTWSTITREDGKDVWAYQPPPLTRV